jgi:hypothetical protein
MDLETGSERQLTSFAPDFDIRDFDIRDFDISSDGGKWSERVQERSDGAGGSPAPVVSQIA